MSAESAIAAAATRRSASAATCCVRVCSAAVPAHPLCVDNNGDDVYADTLPRAQVTALGFQKAVLMLEAGLL